MKYPTIRRYSITLPSLRCFGITLILCLTGLSSAWGAQDQDTRNINVLAHHSLALPLAEISRAYTRERRVTINLTFGEASVQTQQIIRGAACDLFIGAGHDAFAALRAEGVVDVYSQRPLIWNALAFMGPQPHYLEDDWKDPTRFAATLQEKYKKPLIAVPKPDMAAGKSVAETLGRVDPSGLLIPYLRSYEHEADFFSLTPQEQRFGYMLYTDALRYGATPIGIVPAELHTPIRYEAVVVGGENMTAARKFLDYLTTSRAKAVFRRYGFST